MLKDNRMQKIYDFVKPGDKVCDIGTDHAYIPVELLKNGKCPSAIITDISLPSLRKGIKNAEKESVIDKICAYEADGTIGVDNLDAGSYIIAGMGGELISKILEQDIRLKNPDFLFILQPMSRPEHLRRYLYENGFRIIIEEKVKDEERIYPIMKCVYDGIIKEPSLKDIYAGEKVLNNEKLYNAYVLHQIDLITNKLNGLKQGKNINDEEISLLSDILGALKEVIN